MRPRSSERSARSWSARSSGAGSNELWRLILRPRHPSRRRARRAGAGRALRSARGARGGATSTSCSACRRSVPCVAASVRELVRRAAQPRSWSSACATPASRWRRRRVRARPGRPEPLAGKTFVITGTLASMTREAGDGAIERARRQGDRLGEQEDELRRRRRRARQQSSRRRRALGVETLDEAAFLAPYNASHDPRFAWSPCCW